MKNMNNPNFFWDFPEFWKKIWFFADLLWQKITLYKVFQMQICFLRWVFGERSIRIFDKFHPDP